MGCTFQGEIVFDFYIRIFVRIMTIPTFTMSKGKNNKIVRHRVNVPIY